MPAILKYRVIYIGPIWPHYRSSVIDELLKLSPNSVFYGAAEYRNNTPIINNCNVFNIFKKSSFKIFGHTFYWYHNILQKFKITQKDKFVITGFDPHMLHLIFLVFYLKYCKKIPFYWWSHANYGAQGKIGIIFRMIFYRMANGVFTYSKAGALRLIDHGIKKNMITVINNSLNYEDYGWMANKKRKKLNNDFRIILTGKLNKEKKIHILIDAMRILVNKKENILCTLVGDGTEREDLENLVTIYELDKNVKIVGAKYGEEIHRYLFSSDLYIIPGAVGLSIVHGFSFGLPIITSNDFKIHGPEIELLEIGKNGDVFNDDDPLSLANKILEWRIKLASSSTQIRSNCIQAIINKKYLPNMMAGKIYKRVSSLNIANKS